jgi:uncharacterized protein (DUF2147 family)
MKRLFILLYSFFAFAASSQQESDRIIGYWLVSSGKAKIQITRYGEKFGGRIAWMKEPNDEKGQPKLDPKNPDPAKRKNPRLGLNLALGFTYDEDGKYEGGTIYDPESGKTYKCIMTLEGDKLKVRGYVGFSLIGRTDVWTRVKE